MFYLGDREALIKAIEAKARKKANDKPPEKETDKNKELLKDKEK